MNTDTFPALSDPRPRLRSKAPVGRGRLFQGDTMHRTRAAMLLTAVALSLAACSTAAPAAAPAAEQSTTQTATPSPTPTPTPSPTPTEMTPAAAGKYYLDHTCPVNKVTTDLDTVAARNPLDLPAAKAAAGKRRDALADLARALASPPVPWPASVRGDAQNFVEALYKEVSQTENLAQQTTVAGFTAAWNNWPDTGAGAPSQALRIKLGLSSDAKGSCGLS